MADNGRAIQAFIAAMLCGQLFVS